MVEAILSLRRQHPRWGPRKLLVVLRRRAPSDDGPWQARSENVLRRVGWCAAAAPAGQHAVG